MSSLLSYETLVHAIAGATGSIIGMAAFYPLDTLRSRQQVQDCTELEGNTWKLLLKLFNEEGAESLYRGLLPVLQSLSVSNFIYFYAFHSLRKSSMKKNNSALGDLMFGVLAGSANVLITSPLWVVNTRIKLEKNYTSLSQGLYEIAKKEGIKGLWSGTLPSLLLVSNPAIQFMIYEYLKRHFVSGRCFNTLTAFLIGAIAKGIATSLTYPLQLVQSRLRAGSSMKPLLNDVKRNPINLFRGLEAKLLQTIMTAALMFLVYEKIVRFTFAVMRVKIPK